VVPSDLSVPGGPVAAFAVSLVLYFALRAGRWWFLVRAVGPISFRDATLVALAGILWVVAMPFRLGEFVRPYLAHRQAQIPMEAALGTVAVERLVDGLVVCALFFGMLGRPPEAGPLATVWHHAIVVVALFGAVLVATVVMARAPEATADLARRFVGRIAPAAAERAARFVRGLSSGLTTLPDLRPLAPFLLATMAYWVVNVGGVWILARGFGLPLSFLQVGAAVAVLNMVLLVPAGPAMTGSYQAGLALGLAFFAPAELVRTIGAKVIFWSYLLQLAATVLFGLSAHALLGISARQITRAEATDVPPPSGTA